MLPASGFPYSVRQFDLRCVPFHSICLCSSFQQLFHCTISIVGNRIAMATPKIIRQELDVSFVLGQYQNVEVRGSCLAKAYNSLLTAIGSQSTVLCLWTSRTIC